MHRWVPISAVFFASLACGVLGGPPTLTTETYASHRACGRDPSYPELTLMRIEADGSHDEIWGGPTGREAVRWGRRTTVRVASTYDPVVQHTSRRIDAVLEEVETPGEAFRIHACAATFLGADRRSFMDGKPFGCPDPAVCAELDRRAEADPKAAFDLQMRHAANVDDPLILEAVLDRTCATTLDCDARDQCCKGACVPLATCE
ncbi:MAG: hypothetical protein H6737_07595 [Alphaproteobacteria bacterium]|nr:hypothetical protein [Alphaproteobacteria bacterium]